MRIAVLSDIHGHKVALKAVLSDIDHVSRLSEFARKLDLSRLIVPFKLNRRSKPNQPDDEFDLVVSAFNDMRTTLKKSTEELEGKARMEGELKAAAEIQQWFFTRLAEGRAKLDVKFEQLLADQGFSTELKEWPE